MTSKESSKDTLWGPKRRQWRFRLWAHIQRPSVPRTPKLRKPNIECPSTASKTNFEIYGTARSIQSSIMESQSGKTNVVVRFILGRGRNDERNGWAGPGMAMN